MANDISALGQHLHQLLQYPTERMAVEIPSIAYAVLVFQDYQYLLFLFSEERSLSLYETRQSTQTLFFSQGMINQPPTLCAPLIF